MYKLFFFQFGTKKLCFVVICVKNPNQCIGLSDDRRSRFFYSNRERKTYYLMIPIKIRAIYLLEF
ncbi:hypothetical protein BpHYR1_028535 [Brachionus plicatilis]|uniref:Uncharacterized protein n=1 Tax=Brachionus plicatilis TaxID=10195 RepID=A0A3M7Q2G8_BRAPC|nr:hypothetical protein BpHYR1_028535 [Brachionus plicatilis]